MDIDSKQIQIQVLPELAFDANLLKAKLSKKLRIKESDIKHVEINRRSIDARKKPIKYQLLVTVYLQEYQPKPIQMPDWPVVSDDQPVHIIGAGPAGLFAALKCIELGIKPIVFERGKDVRARRRDLVQHMRYHRVNPESNYCFGEGGAGTYSDGKLYTRSKKKGDLKNVLRLLVAFGADQNILVDSQPHIGTNKLPDIIASIRKFIIAKGGEVNFNAKLSNIQIENDRISKIRINKNWITCDRLILATGHSARDIFEMLQSRTVQMEAKPFAIGVRVEHPQTLINKIQYHGDASPDFLPAAAYKIVKQVNGRGVYSFCMCPGGIIAPCATEPGEIVTNGWSPSKRNMETANSGIVCELQLNDFKAYDKDGPLAGLYFQKQIEQKAWELAGKTQAAPAQRLIDFIHDRKSKHLPENSYHPGVVSVKLSELFPDFIYKALVNGLKQMGRSMPGFLNNQAIVVGPESRTSSPIRIPRDYETYEHPSIKGLYPCGEGAGYAGGIMSAAIDGMNVVKGISEENKKLD